MSFKSLLSHRCDLYDLRTTDNDGSPITQYVKVNTKPVRCRLDLAHVRHGKDSMWMETIARPEDRTGVMFFLPTENIKSGMRVKMLKGPRGVFSLQGALDEVFDFSDHHHYEVGVVEVSSLQYRRAQSQESL